MYSSFVREQKRYTIANLCDKLKCSEDTLIPIIRKLKEYGVLKAVKSTDQQKDMSDLADTDIEVADVEVGENEYLYVFTYVGVAIISGYVLKCYPKYLLTKQAPKAELCQVLKVLEKYNSKEQIIRMFNDTSESSSFNLLAVLLFLIRDYYENGVYSNTEDIIETNGSGEILWDKTINETFTYLSNNRPYYPELLTRKRINNDTDYFKRLHECILTKASREMKNADLLDLFETTEIDLTDEELDDFGDKEYVLYRIEKELNTQFNTRKQLVLKTIYAYIYNTSNLNETDCVSMFGTNSFNLVWEEVCAKILDNKLKCPLKDLPLPPQKTSIEFNPTKLLIDLIEKPYWTFTQKEASDTLIPDLIAINGSQFLIFDAKYYTPKLELNQKPEHQPGIESVTKQYLYQLAYKDFIKAYEFTDIKNCFLMPTEKEDVQNMGTVTMKMFRDLNLTDIEVRYIPATTAYRYYLSGATMNLSELKLEEK